MEYASNGKGNLAVTLGAIGTGLGVMSGTGLLAGMGGAIPGHNFVSKDELDYVQQLSAKDSQIAILEADAASEKKMIEVYRQSHDELVTLRDKIDSDLKELQKEVNSNRRDQDGWNAAQAVANTTMANGIAANNAHIETLQASIAAITQVKIPNTAICPGWGAITVTPTTGV